MNTKQKLEKKARSKVYTKYIRPTLTANGQNPNDRAAIAKLLGNTGVGMSKEKAVAKSVGVPHRIVKQVRENNYSKLYVNNNSESGKLKKKYKKSGIDF